MHEFIAIDESDLIEAGIKAYEDETQEAIYAGDERRFMIHSFAYMILLAAKEINYGLNQQFSTTAEEDGLEVIGNEYQVSRLPSEKAVVNMKFALSKEQGNGIIIPYGTRVTHDGKHFFATSKAVIVEVGTTDIDIECIATVDGSDGYNNIPANSITTLVDNVQGVVSVTNTEISAGGSDIEDIEDWRERINLKKRGMNTAGSEQAYIYHIKSSDASIGDVKLVNDGDAVVKAVVLCKGGVLPNSGLLDRIMENVSKDDKRPLTDLFEVISPNVVNYSIEFKYTISPDDMDRLELIKENVRLAAEQFRDEIGEHLGRDIIPDTLRKYILNAGASTVTITSPTDTVIDDCSVAKLDGDISITYEGMR